MLVPTNRIYAPGQALLNLFPLPNTAQVSNFNYTSQFPGKSPRRETLLRWTTTSPTTCASSATD